MREAVIVINKILLTPGRPEFTNADLSEAINTINAVNIERGNEGFKLGKAGTIRADGALYKDLSESKNPDAKALLETIVKGEEFAKKGKTNDRFEIKNGVLIADLEFYKTLADSVQNALKKGVELAAADEPKKAPAPKAEKAAPAPAAAAPAERKYNPEALSKWLSEANALVAAGKDLSSMSPEAQKAVEIQPAMIIKTELVKDGDKTRKLPVLVDGKEVMIPNPKAGKVGLTASAYQHVTGTIVSSKQVIGNDKVAQGIVREHQERLVAYEEVLATARASLGIEPTPAPAPEKELAHAGPAMAT